MRVAEKILLHVRRHRRRVRVVDEHHSLGDRCQPADCMTATKGENGSAVWAALLAPPYENDCSGSSIVGLANSRTGGPTSRRHNCCCQYLCVNRPLGDKMPLS